MERAGLDEVHRSLIRGTLRETHVDAFARYLVRYVDAYAGEGVPIFALTVQNEPAFEPGDYPGMRLGARAALRRDRSPGTAARPARSRTCRYWIGTTTGIPNEPPTVLADPQANRFVAGVAWHCYGGDVSRRTRCTPRCPTRMRASPSALAAIGSRSTPAG